jgi:hypothetical protein
MRASWLVHRLGVPLGSGSLVRTGGFDGGTCMEFARFVAWLCRLWLLRQHEGLSVGSAELVANRNVGLRRWGERWWRSGDAELVRTISAAAGASKTHIPPNDWARGLAGCLGGCCAGSDTCLAPVGLQSWAEHCALFTGSLDGVTPHGRLRLWATVLRDAPTSACPVRERLLRELCRCGVPESLRGKVWADRMKVLAVRAEEEAVWKGCQSAGECLPVARGSLYWSLVSDATMPIGRGGLALLRDASPPRPMSDRSRLGRDAMVIEDDVDRTSHNLVPLAELRSASGSVGVPSSDALRGWRDFHSTALPDEDERAASEWRLWAASSERRAALEHHTGIALWGLHSDPPSALSGADEGLPRLPPSLVYRVTDGETHDGVFGRRVLVLVSASAMRRVLRSVAKLRPTIGYVQGLNFLCAVLLRYFEEEAAFWALVGLLDGASTVAAGDDESLASLMLHSLLGGPKRASLFPRGFFGGLVHCGGTTSIPSGLVLANASLLPLGSPEATIVRDIVKAATSDAEDEHSGIALAQRETDILSKAIDTSPLLASLRVALQQDGMLPPLFLGHTLSWFLTAFAAGFAPRLVSRVWDHAFVEGRVVIHRVSVEILRAVSGLVTGCLERQMGAGAVMSVMSAVPSAIESCPVSSDPPCEAIDWASVGEGVERRVGVADLVQRYACGCGETADTVVTGVCGEVLVRRAEDDVTYSLSRVRSLGGRVWCGLPLGVAALVHQHSPDWAWHEVRSRVLGSERVTDATALLFDGWSDSASLRLPAAAVTRLTGAGAAASLPSATDALSDALVPRETLRQAVSASLEALAKWQAATSVVRDASARASDADDALSDSSDESVASGPTGLREEDMELPRRSGGDSLEPLDVDHTVSHHVSVGGMGVLARLRNGRQRLFSTFRGRRSEWSDAASPLPSPTSPPPPPTAQPPATTTPVASPSTTTTRPEDSLLSLQRSRAIEAIASHAMAVASLSYRHGVPEQWWSGVLCRLERTLTDVPPPVLPRHVTFWLLRLVGDRSTSRWLDGAAPMAEPSSASEEESLKAAASVAEREQQHLRALSHPEDEARWRLVSVELVDAAASGAGRPSSFVTKDIRLARPVTSHPPQKWLRRSKQGRMVVALRVWGMEGTCRPSVVSDAVSLSPIGGPAAAPLPWARRWRCLSTPGIEKGRHPSSLESFTIEALRDALSEVTSVGRFVSAPSSVGVSLEHELHRWWSLDESARLSNEHSAGSLFGSMVRREIARSRKLLGDTESLDLSSVVHGVDVLDLQDAGRGTVSGPQLRKWRMVVKMPEAGRRVMVDGLLLREGALPAAAKPLVRAYPSDDERRRVALRVTDVRYSSDVVTSVRLPRANVCLRAWGNARSGAIASLTRGSVTSPFLGAGARLVGGGHSVSDVSGGGAGATGRREVEATLASLGCCWSGVTSVVSSLLALEELSMVLIGQRRNERLGVAHCVAASLASLTAPASPMLAPANPLIDAARHHLMDQLSASAEPPLSAIESATGLQPLPNVLAAAAVVSIDDAGTDGMNVLQGWLGAGRSFGLRASLLQACHEAPLGSVAFDEGESADVTARRIVAAASDGRSDDGPSVSECGSSVWLNSALTVSSSLSEWARARMKLFAQLGWDDWREAFRSCLSKNVGHALDPDRFLLPVQSPPPPRWGGLALLVGTGVSEECYEWLLLGDGRMLVDRDEEEGWGGWYTGLEPEVRDAAWVELSDALSSDPPEYPLARLSSDLFGSSALFPHEASALSVFDEDDTPPAPPTPVAPTGPSLSASGPSPFSRPPGRVGLRVIEGGVWGFHDLVGACVSELVAGLRMWTGATPHRSMSQDSRISSARSGRMGSGAVRSIERAQRTQEAGLELFE